jgi:cation transport regulator
MPYTAATAPKAVKDALPAAALKIWVAACNSALKQYPKEETAFKVAWAAVKQKYRQDKDGNWVAIKKVEIRGDILKVDKATRLVWGWGSVAEVDGVPVTDSQGDQIDPAELQAAVHDYVKSLRHAKVMHEGEVVGEVVDSFVWTADLQKAFGVDFGRVGWALGMEMPAEVVERVEAGEYGAFSIAGTAARLEIPDAE